MTDLQYDIAVSTVVSSPRGGDPTVVVSGPHRGTEGVLLSVERNRVTIGTYSGFTIKVPRPYAVVDTTRWSDDLEARVLGLL